MKNSTEFTGYLKANAPDDLKKFMLDAFESNKQLLKNELAILGRQCISIIKISIKVPLWFIKKPLRNINHSILFCCLLGFHYWSSLFLTKFF